MSNNWQAVIASFFTMAIVTVVGVLLFFRPIEGHDVASPEWHPLLAITVYLTLSVVLHDWAARRMQSSYSAAFVIAGAQVIFIVDLLARGERGLLTALAGTALVAATWSSVAVVHSMVSRNRRQHTAQG